MTDVLQQPEPDLKNKVLLFIELDTRRKTIEETLKGLKSTLNGMNKELVDEFAMAGFQSIKTDQGTCHLQNRVSAGYITDREQLGDALSSDPSTEHLVRPTYNAMSLASWAKEIENEESGEFEIPEHLES